MVPLTIDSWPSQRSPRRHDAEKIGAYVLRRRNDAFAVLVIGLILPSGWSYTTHLALLVTFGAIVYCIVVRALRLEAYTIASRLVGAFFEQVRARYEEEKQSPTEVYREFNNIMRLSGREQVSP